MNYKRALYKTFRVAYLCLNFPSELIDRIHSYSHEYNVQDIIFGPLYFKTRKMLMILYPTMYFISFPMYMDESFLNQASCVYSGKKLVFQKNPLSIESSTTNSTNSLLPDQELIFHSSFETQWDLNRMASKQRTQSSSHYDHRKTHENSKRRLQKKNQKLKQKQRTKRRHRARDSKYPAPDISFDSISFEWSILQTEKEEEIDWSRIFPMCHENESESMDMFVDSREKEDINFISKYGLVFF